MLTVTFSIMILIVVLAARGDARRFGVRPLRRLRPDDGLLTPQDATPSAGESP